MSISDILISVVVWFVLHFIVPIFPANLPFFSITEYYSLLDTLKTDIVSGFSGLEFILPINLILIIVSIIIFCEWLLLTFKAVKFVLNLVRGAGA